MNEDLTRSIIADLCSHEGDKRPRTVCSDGFSMSIQASRFHYCTPRENKGPWTAFEVGFPSHGDNLLIPYAEDPERPTETVYGWVPAEIVAQVILNHGGLPAPKSE